MDIAIANRQRTKKINQRLLKQICRALLAELKLEKADIGICLVGESEITLLNETFLHHAGPTDVIAFDYHGNTNPGGQRSVAAQKSRALTKPCPPGIHGEIFICMDEAIRQARQFGATWQSEIVRYLVHGVLHLLGHDDIRAAARRKMKREENRLLREISRRFSLSKL
jgi:probable rRNA maturation factor